MKKIALIFLISIYAFSTTGISLKGFYCCDKLKSVRLTLADYGKDKDGCCKTKYQSFKIKDTHAAADAITAPVLHYALIHSFDPVFQTPAFISPQAIITNNGHAPPLYNGIPVYISNCIYRI
jgi:hypothetical protein